MCRIAGIISNQLPPDELREKVGIMCNALRHGGPDDGGIYTNDDERLCFGHRRLSIIDLSANGHQPMADIDKKAWISFNGEIYNYLDLKEQLLKAGARFHSNTDTEVILLAYLYWGNACFNKLQGMFAFALYDIEKEITYLVRDSSGIKPLYYCTANNSLSFASETKALKLAGIATQPNENWQVRFLAYGYIPEPYTALRNVFNLPKGHFLCWDNRTGSHIINCYVVQPALNTIVNEREAKEYIHNSLKQAVSRQLMADAPLGVFLSGGIDSSILTLLAAQNQRDLKTISIFFDEKAYDERAYQNLVADKITGEKFAHLVKQRDFNNHLSQIIGDMDMPTTDGINSWFISKYAHEDGLKAVLSGVGADELFGGYPSFNRIKHINLLRKLPIALLNAARYFKKDKYKKIAYLAHNHYLADYLLLRGLFTPDDIAKILNTDTVQVEHILFNEANNYPVKKYNKDQASWFETNLYMQNQLLRDTDVMSMSHGLEVRVPFLDEKFIQAVQSISPAIRFDNHQPKKLLIDSFTDMLPAAIWNRPKMGFTFPLQQWMKQHPEISNEDVYKNIAAKNIIKKFKNNELHWSKAFTLYQLQLHG
ncbi:MAG: asparagine synthase (glutamine-hydrolyzing) [Mucilaginibacter sp.]